MAPRAALNDMTNAKAEPQLVEKPSVKKTAKQLRVENETLRAQVADLNAALSKLAIAEESKPKPTVVNPFGPVTTTAPAPLPPKRACSAYLYFMRDARSARSDELSGKSVSEATALVASWWKAAEAEARAPYEKLAAEDKERHAKEFATFQTRRDNADRERRALEAHFHEQKVAAALALYDEQMSSVKKPVVKEEPAPKGARSAYLLYSVDRRAQLVDENLSFADLTRRVADDWKKVNASKSKKNVALVNKYQKLAEEDRVRYEEERAVYDARMTAVNEERERVEREEFERTKHIALRAFNKKEAEANLFKQAVVSKAQADRATKDEKRRIREQKRAEKEAKALLPKKPRSAYILFSSAMRAEVLANNDKMAPSDVMRELAALWKSANKTTKVKFEKDAAADKVRYEKEMAKVQG